MKIVSFLNVSNISNLEADSGYIFNRLLIGELTKRGHEIVLVGPPKMPDLPPGVMRAEIQFPHSKYGVRFGFPWIELEKQLSTVIQNTDVILVNQSELSIPLSVMVYELLGKKVRCVTYFHYLAVKSVRSGHPVFDPSLNDLSTAEIIWGRQVESARFSDFNIIGSQFGKELFLQASGCRDAIEGKFTVIPPPVPPPVEVCYRTVGEDPTILYNHRLYEHYGTRDIFNVLSDLSTFRTFRVLVTDPTHNRSVLRDRLDDSVVNLKQWISTMPFTQVSHFGTQAEYSHAIASADIALAPMRVGALWSMAMADAMSVGVPVVAPDSGAYPEVVGDAELLFSSSAQLHSILDRLLSEPAYCKAKGASAKERTRMMSAKAIADRFESLFRCVVEGGVTT